jgi:hypothetical protein
MVEPSTGGQLRRPRPEVTTDRLRDAKVERGALNRSRRAQRYGSLVNGQVPTGWKTQDVRLDGATVRSQKVEVGVLGQVQDGRFVAGGGIVDSY